MFEISEEKRPKASSEIYLIYEEPAAMQLEACYKEGSTYVTFNFQVLILQELVKEVYIRKDPNMIELYVEMTSLLLQY